LDEVPGAFTKDFVFAKAAEDSLRFPWVLMVHELEVQVWSCTVTGMAYIGQQLA
jgi:hypothetical protein